MFSLSHAQVGDQLPPLKIPPLTRHTLALYCGGSGDHTRAHTDIDYAREHGLGDVIGHGMLSMAYAGRLLSEIAPPESLRFFSVRFSKITRVGDQLTCSGQVIERTADAGTTYYRLNIKAATEDGATVIAGDAVIAI